jgi:hypothetical protein
MVITYDAQSNIDVLPITSAIMMRSTSGGTVYANITASTADFDYFLNNAVAGDAFYIGFYSNMINQTWAHNIIFNIGTAIVADSITVAYEYSTGSSSWATIPNLVDDTNIFRNVGSYGMYFDPPLNWYAQVLNNITYFWIRIRITAVTNITEGGANATNKVKANNGLLFNTNTTLTGMSNIYTAEIAGTRQLLNPIAASANISLYCQPKPLDWGSTNLSFVVTGLSVNGTITITGTDSIGNAITENISVTGNGTYISILSYASINTSGISCTGTYNIEIKQPRWGVIGKYQIGLYSFNKVVFLNGDGINNSPFTETNKQLYFKDAAIYNNNSSVLTFGSLNGSKLGNPMDIMFDLTYWPTRRYEYSFVSSPIATTNLYNSTFTWIINYSRLYVNKGTIRSCKLTNTYYLQVSGNVTLSDIVINAGVGAGFYTTNNAVIVSDLRLENVGIGVLTSGGGSDPSYTNANNSKFIRLNAIDCTYDASLYTSGRAMILVDPIKTPVSTRLEAYWTSGALYKIYLDYTINIKIINKDNNAISGATVVMKKTDGTQMFSVITAADGTITQQQVTSKYWSHTWTGTPTYSPFSDADITDYNPFTLIISRSGYKTYTTKFTFDSKLNWKLTLAKLMDNNFSKLVSINTQ